MKKEVGLWVDHHKAVIVTIYNGVTVTRESLINKEKQVRFSSKADSSISTNFRRSDAEDMLDRKFVTRLNRFYTGIISIIRDADSIWIFGPGEAKAELENRVKKAGLGARVVGIYPMDKMTTPQILTKVQAHYLL